MSDRYTVSENPFGFEADVGTARLRYALTDNRPTHIEIREQLQPCLPGLDHPNKRPPFRHLCYGAHREDLQLVADIMNRREAGELQYRGRNNGL